MASIAEKQDLVQPDDPCNIQFTSGTTGHPKAAVLTHFNLVNNGIMVGKRIELDSQIHRICLQNPLFHVFGVVVGMMAALEYGSTLVLPSAGFDVKASLRAIEKEK